jgi:hypothetical protein
MRNRCLPRWERGRRSQLGVEAANLLKARPKECRILKVDHVPADSALIRSSALVRDGGRGKSSFSLRFSGSYLASDERARPGLKQGANNGAEPSRRDPHVVLREDQQIVTRLRDAAIVRPTEPSRMIPDVANLTWSVRNQRGELLGRETAVVDDDEFSRNLLPLEDAEHLLEQHLPPVPGTQNQGRRQQRSRNARTRIVSIWRAHGRMMNGCESLYPDTCLMATWFRVRMCKEHQVNPNEHS